MLRTLCNLVGITLIFAIVGCQDEKPQPETKDAPFEGVEISIAFPAGYDFKTRWQIELDEWSARTGATYSSHEMVVEGSTTNPTANRPGGDQAVLVLCPMTQVPSRHFAPMSEDILSPKNLHLVDLFEGLRKGPASVGGKPALLPISSPVLSYYYRQDVFDELKLKPPATWDDHHKLVEALAQHNLAVAAPWSERFCATMFLARAVSYAKHPHQYSLFFDVESCDPLIDGPGFIRALTEARRDVDAMQAQGVETKLSPGDCRTMLLTGKAAVAITYESLAEEEKQERPDEAVIACVRLPGNPQAFNRSTKAWESMRDESVNRCSLTAFSGLCVGVSADATEGQQRAAWELLAQIAVDSSQLLRAFPAEARSLCRESQLNQPAAWVGTGMSAGESRQVAEAIATSLRDPRLVAELPVVGRERYRQALTEGLVRFLNDDTTAEKALRQVADDWREITADIGQHIVLNSYRRSIGLSERRKR